MRFRHTTALALVGWYLMVPAAANPAGGCYKPLSQWKVMDTFDSRAACEKSQAAFHTTKITPTRRKDAKIAGPSLCVAADDLRLKGD
jgi:hypothetical protein